MILSKLFYQLKLRKADPYEKAIIYARHEGIKMGMKCKCFGKVDFGSEPYLITLGDNVMISDNVRFVNHDGGIQVLDVNGWLPNSDIFGVITVGNNVFIGQNATILKGVHIGNNVIIGAGAIVSKDCEDDSVYAGIPARKIKTLHEYYENIKDRADFTLNYTPEAKKEYLLKKFRIEG